MPDLHMSHDINNVAKCAKISAICPPKWHLFLYQKDKLCGNASAEGGGSWRLGLCRDLLYIIIYTLRIYRWQSLGDLGKHQ